MHTLGRFSAVTPKAAIPYCDAILARFARSSSDFLHSLKTEAVAVLGDHAVVSGYEKKLPSGMIRGLPILDGLIDSLSLCGHFERYKKACTEQVGVQWIFDSSVSPPSNTSVQTACYNAFLPHFCEKDFPRAVAQKLVITLGESLANSLRLPVDWHSHVFPILALAKEHVKMCVLKTWIGGWTTSARMGESVRMECIFGCKHEGDDLRHYIQCSPLWQLAGEAINVLPPFDLVERLCLVHPTSEKFVMLALAFQGYHHAKSLCEGQGEQRLIVQDQRRLQTAVQQAMKSFVHNFG